MSERELLQAILDDPDNDAPRLAFADWLEANGDLVRAQFIRLQIEEGRYHLGDLEYYILSKQSQILLERHRCEWEAKPAWVSFLGYRRGFPFEVTAKIEDWLAQGEGAFESMPIESVSVNEFVSSTEREEFLHSPLTVRLRQFRLSGPMHAPDLRVLANSPFLAQLRRLDLFCHEIDDDGAIALAESPYLNRVEELVLSHNEIGPAGFEAIVQSRGFRRLARLEMSMNPQHRSDPIGDRGMSALCTSTFQFRGLKLGSLEITDQGIEHLCEARCASGLVELDLASNNVTEQGTDLIFDRGPAQLECLGLRACSLGDEGVRGIARATRERPIRRLDLARCGIRTRGAELLASALALRNLADLDLSDNAIGDAGLIALARSPILQNLRDLKLDSNGITSAGVCEMCRLGAFPNLARLSLNENQVDDRGVEAIARAQEFGGLRVLILHANEVTDVGAAALAGCPNLANLFLLHLAGNGIGNIGARALVNAFLPRGAFVTLHGNHIDADVWEELDARGGELISSLSDPSFHSGHGSFESYDQLQQWKQFLN